MAAKGSEKPPSIQPHILRARAHVRAFIKEQKLLPEPPQFVISDGLAVVQLARPITRGDLHQLSYLYAADPDALKAQHEETAADEASIAAGGFSWLTKTTKMGAYSFNLPAGPTGAFGTCPIASLAWPQEQWRAQPKLNPAGKRALGKAEMLPSQWVCSHCYGLKGAYGSPSVIVIQELRRQVVESLMVDPRRLADLMVATVRVAQIKSARTLARLRLMAPSEQASKVPLVPAPEFFRIHDSGDFGLGPKYVEAWMAACHLLAKPVTLKVPLSITGPMPDVIGPDTWGKGLDLTLPAVRLWAATRMWGVDAGLEGVADSSCGASLTPKCIPANLSIRPSGLRLGSGPPSGLPLGYAKASAVATVDELKTLTDWVCPAYLPVAAEASALGVKAGGASAKRSKAPGACPRAAGPDAADSMADRPSPVGHGCRTCWLDTDKSVGYPFH